MQRAVGIAVLHLVQIRQSVEVDAVAAAGSIGYRRADRRDLDALVRPVELQIQVGAAGEIRSSDEIEALAFPVADHLVHQSQVGSHLVGLRAESGRRDHLAFPPMTYR